MENEPIQPRYSPVNIVLSILFGLATFFFGWSGRVLQAIPAATIPRDLLIAGLLLCLGLISLLTLLVVVLWRENTKIRLTPIWYPRFGAQWKYQPGQRRFHPWPYCICCPAAPKSLRFQGMNEEFKVEHLRCPIEKTDWFLLADTGSGKEEYLTVKQALERITKEVSHAH